MQAEGQVRRGRGRRDVGVPELHHRGRDDRPARDLLDDAHLAVQEPGVGAVDRRRDGHGLARVEQDPGGPGDRHLRPVDEGRGGRAVRLGRGDAGQHGIAARRELALDVAVPQLDEERVVAVQRVELDGRPVRGRLAAPVEHVERDPHPRLGAQPPRLRRAARVAGHRLLPQAVREAVADVR
ncbi:hypothetical protein ACFQU9_37325 [Actinomadura namibiensis]|uniref:Uncharacterized protein n=1 Tax=Actinomadura namibiensis TaxID=182080 RepID=A0A7W3LKL2_ACTNM|nr:hypothetical protein [Actinomadura namibiensis]MBA8949863.1 hypothetical protein [Actinomadura namibiensis]